MATARVIVSVSIDLTDNGGGFTTADFENVAKGLVSIAGDARVLASGIVGADSSGGLGSGSGTVADPIS